MMQPRVTRVWDLPYVLWFGKGMGLVLRVMVPVEESMTDVERSKRHQFTSQVSNQRSSQSSRSC